MATEEARNLISKDSLLNNGNLLELVDGSETTLHSHVGGGFTSRCSVYLSGDQTISNGTVTVVEFDSENYDNDSEFNVSNHRFTPSVNGYYHISFIVYLDPPNLAVDFNAQAFIALNDNIDRRVTNRPALTSTTLALSISIDLYLTTNDYIEGQIWTSDTSSDDATLKAGQKTIMTIHRFA